MENPAWYTAYTPYQPEISQGRLEALLNFQTVVTDLTGLHTAGASLLDEATAAAEAMTLARRQCKVAGARSSSTPTPIPQTVAVLRTRAEPLGIDLAGGGPRRRAARDPRLRPAACPTRAAPGRSATWPALAARGARARGALVVAATDLLALTLLTPPGEWGADVAVGSSQRFGVPLGFGGPHAGFMAVRGRPGAGAARAARRGQRRRRRRPGLPARAADPGAAHPPGEGDQQHLHRPGAPRRDGRGMYAVYHGPEGLTTIARRTHRYAAVAGGGAARGRARGAGEAFFDTVTVGVPGRCRRRPRGRLEQRGEPAPGRRGHRRAEHRRDDHRARTCAPCWPPSGCADDDLDALDAATDGRAAGGADLRTSAFLTHPVFRSHRSETAMLRYLTRLAGKDYALDRGHDPARLLHHEAQRGHRDGADHLARVRRHPPVRPDRPGRAATCELIGRPRALARAR